MKVTKKFLQDLLDDPKNTANDLSIDELVSLLRKLSDAYYNTGNSLVDDDTFDIIKDILHKRDPQNNFLLEVGAPIKGEKNKVDLPYPMGSLSKIKESDDLEKWTEKHGGPYVVSDKMDGASAQIYKNNSGKMFMYSRGDGFKGQDISHLLSVINISKNISTKMPNGTSVRGELIISKEDFEKLKDKENARNTVAGLVNSKTVDKTIAKMTKFIAYSILNPRYKQSEQMEKMIKWGFDVVNYITVDELSKDRLSKYLKIRKSDNIYDIDGIVCVDDSKAYIHSGGFPTYAFAFKMITADQMTNATVVEVNWEPSMDGYLKPTIKIKPVKLVGTTITYATAHNAKFVFDNVIGPGAVIKIIRSGDVIPYIMSVEKISTSGKPQMPTIPYKWNDTEVDIIATEIEGVVKDKINTQILTHFFKTMEIKYISSGILSKFVENGYNTVIKILNADIDDLVEIHGVGDKMVVKIFDEIKTRLKEADLSKIMAASRKFGRGMGERKIREITTMYPNIMSVNWDNNTMIEKILEVSGFSDKLANKFVDNLQKFKIFFKEIEKIYDLSHMKKTATQPKKREKKLEGEKIVFTGFRDKEFEKFIVENGGKVSTSVSSNTTILIHADGADTSSSKFTKAKELKITIMDKSEFYKKYMK
jgi:DNA ligase (NAD+)